MPKTSGLIKIGWLRRVVSDLGLVAVLFSAAILSLVVSTRASGMAWYYTGDCSGGSSTTYALTFGYGYGGLGYGAGYGACGHPISWVTVNCPQGGYGYGYGSGNDGVVMARFTSPSSSIALDRALNIGDEHTWEFRIRFAYGAGVYGAPMPGYGAPYGQELRIYSEFATPQGGPGQSIGVRRNEAGESVLRFAQGFGASTHEVIVSNLQDTRWHHLAIVRTASEFRLFLDGHLVTVEAAFGAHLPICGLRAFGAFREPDIGGMPGIVRQSAAFDLDWVRVSRLARYPAGDFEPPSEEELLPDLQTALLMRFVAPPHGMWWQNPTGAILDEGPDQVVGWWGVSWAGAAVAPEWVALPADDEDGDGVPLALDQCPDLPGNSSNVNCYGCPLNPCGLCGSDGLADTDLDGIQDCVDPDDDNDGVLDWRECSSGSTTTDATTFGYGMGFAGYGVPQGGCGRATEQVAVRCPALAYGNPLAGSSVARFLSANDAIALDRSLDFGAEHTWEFRLRFAYGASGYGANPGGYGIAFGKEVRIFSEASTEAGASGQSIGLTRTAEGDCVIRYRQCSDAPLHEVVVPELLDTRWHHVAMVRTAASFQLFLDGHLMSVQPSHGVRVPVCGARGFGAFREPGAAGMPDVAYESAIFDLDWVRVSRIARYEASDFVAPLENELVPDAQTALLMRFGVPGLSDWWSQDGPALEEGPDQVVAWWGASWSGAARSPDWVQFAADDPDADGVPQAIDQCPELPGNQTNPNCLGCPLNACGLCGPGGDLDQDGVEDAQDAFPCDSSESVDTDADGIGNNADADDDNDTFFDWDDAFPLLATEWRDFDGDGTGDNADLDDDNDGVPDVDDWRPNDPSESRDQDGDGIGDNADLDDDNDGVADSADNCANAVNPLQEDVDGDGTGDACDPDNDNDGIPDASDNCRLIPNPGQQDCDGDGVGDVCELGLIPHLDDAVQWPESQGGNGHWYKLVQEGRSWHDAKAVCESMGGHLVTITSEAEAAFVNDLAGWANPWIGAMQDTWDSSCEPANCWQWVNGEPWSATRWCGGQPDNGGNSEHFVQLCAGTMWNDLPGHHGVYFVCEWSEPAETDCNHNGIPDSCEGDCNGDGIGDACDPGVSTIVRSTPDLPFPCCGSNQASTANADVSGWERAGGPVTVRLYVCAYLAVDPNQSTAISIDGHQVWQGPLLGWQCGWQPAIEFQMPGDVFNRAAGDGSLAIQVITSGVHNYGYCCNAFRLDFRFGSVPFDCNGNGIADSCDVRSGVDGDCNGDGVPNACEIAYLGALDCNRNGIPDTCDIASGYSTDVDVDGIPDDCETDCNRNGRPDEYDIAITASRDCNANAVPDECEDGSVAQWTGNMGRFGTGMTATGMLRGMGIAASPVQVTVRARGDLNGTTEFITLSLGGRRISNLFVAGGSDCPVAFDTETVTISDETWNELVAAGSGDVAVLVATSPLVDSAQCPSPLIDVRVDYKSPRFDCDRDGLSDVCRIASGGVPDCNGNVVPDSCDIASGFSRDCDANGVPDNCDIAAGALDEDLNGMPDRCQIAYGDFDLDGHVTTADLSVLLMVFGDVGSPFGDFDGDDIITVADLSIMLMNFGPVPN